MKKPLQNRQTLHKTLARGRVRRNAPVVHIPIVEEELLPVATPAETPKHPRPSAPPNGGWTRSGVFRFAIIVLSVLGIVATATVAVSRFIPAPILSTDSNTPVVVSNDPIPVAIRRAFDGVFVYSSEQQNPPLVAISIDNSIDARPQLGVDQALWVYEFPAEATITRWLGVFAAEANGDNVAQIGPVRSIRPYMAEIARSIGAVVVHSGGSPDALSLVGRFARDYPSINEFSQTPYFWRDPTRVGPHNLFTAISRLREHPIVKARISTLKPFAWKEVVADTTREVLQKQLVISYQQPYQARWRYSSTDQLFHRVDEDGAPWKSPSGAELTTPTIVVQFTDISVLDQIGRRDVRLKGTGEAMVFHRGSVELGTWVRNTSNDRTILQTVDGEPLAISAGRVWWSIVSNGTEVTFE